MRIAILHDYLNQFGGAERVLEVLLELFPNADLYTLLYDEERIGGRFRANLKKTSVLDFPFARRNHRMFIPIMPWAVKSVRGDAPYDLVISSTAGYAKGFPVKGRYHISYCHSPLRYAWELDYLKDLPFSPASFVKGSFRRPAAEVFQRWDKRAADGVNIFVANSSFIREKIRSYYDRDAYIIYPPVEDSVFRPLRADTEQNYYLMAGRLLYYKRFDIGIRAFNELKLPLKIMGTGPEEKKLRAIANSQFVQFISPVSDAALRDLYAGAKAFIFPQIEDFGIVAAEAQSCGTPVIAYPRGGACEIIRHGETGMFFGEQNKDSLITAIREFETKKFDRKKIALSGERFTKENFKRQFLSVVKDSGF
jgi:glycosyltransferase involved in cell wall biosynthesis